MARSLTSIALVALGVAAGAQAAEARPLVSRVHGIATGIAACWRPPHDDDQVTVRVSFTRDGAVIGEPRIVFVQSSGGRSDDPALTHLHSDGDTRLHAFAFLGSAWLGNRGSGSGHTLHWPQPGDDRCVAVMTCSIARQ